MNEKYKCVHPAYLYSRITHQGLSHISLFFYLSLTKFSHREPSNTSTKTITPLPKNKKAKTQANTSNTIEDYEGNIVAFESHPLSVGWRRKTCVRKSGPTKGKFYFYYLSPRGRIFQSLKQAAKHAIVSKESNQGVENTDADADADADAATNFPVEADANDDDDGSSSSDDDITTRMFAENRKKNPLFDTDSDDNDSDGGVSGASVESYDSSAMYDYTKEKGQNKKSPETAYTILIAKLYNDEGLVENDWPEHPSTIFEALAELFVDRGINHYNTVEKLICVVTTHLNDDTTRSRMPLTMTQKTLLRKYVLSLDGDRNNDILRLRSARWIVTILHSLCKILHCEITVLTPPPVGGEKLGMLCLQSVSYGDYLYPRGSNSFPTIDELESVTESNELRKVRAWQVKNKDKNIPCLNLRVDMDFTANLVRGVFPVVADPDNHVPSHFLPCTHTSTTAEDWNCRSDEVQDSEVELEVR